MAVELLFLHLSDIHFNCRGLTDTYDLDVTLRNELERDVRQLRDRLGNASGVLVTGDLAYHATNEQFDVAFQWLAKLCGLVGCPEESVWTVPGNHDVFRSSIEDSELLQTLHRDIRNSAPGKLDETLKKYLDKDKEAGPMLFRPLENYNRRVAEKFRCSVSELRPYWVDDLDLGGGRTLRLCGLTSTMVSDKFDETDKLVLGLTQTDRALLRDDGIEYLVMCHHPPDEFIDHENVNRSFNALARIQLFGHKHTFDLLPQGRSLRLSAGAVHPNRREPKWDPRYNFIAISICTVATCDVLRVVVYPRVWNDSNKSFEADRDPNGFDQRTIDLPVDPLTKQCDLIQTPIPINSERHDVKVSMDHRNSTTESTSPARRLVYRFLTLPYHTQISIANELGLLHESDALAPNGLCSLVCERAREGVQLEALWFLIERAHGSDQPAANPFTGQ